MKASVQEMIKSQMEKSAQKLGAAKSLQQAGYVDDAISRAYYSMFHAASAALLSEDITVESHAALKTMFGLHFIKTGKIARKYGRWLNKVKDARENGDYDIFTGFEESDARESVEQAESFLEELKRFLKASHSDLF